MQTARRFVPWLVVAALTAATAWAIHHSALEPADFTFVNGTEVESIDPAQVTGQPEGRVVDALFEGLLNWHPKTLEPVPGVAERWEISPDKTVYTLFLRHDARWSDGLPVTAHDFRWTFRRMLDPMVGSQYTTLFWRILGREYSASSVEPGDAVEVELNELPAGARPYARGTLLKGSLVQLEKRTAGSKEQRIYLVDIGGRQRRFSPDNISGAESCKQVLFDFDQVGIEVVDDYTLRLKLDYPTPYFLQLLGFYPLVAVPRQCIETYGPTVWTQPQNIVTNGAFHLGGRRIRDRLRLVRSDTYWDRAHVKLNTVDVLAIDSTATALNLYLTGQADWIPNVPATVVADLVAQKRPDFNPVPEFVTYFYRINVTRPPLDNRLVRQALNMALDKREIVAKVTRAGEAIARGMVPPGPKGYESALCGAYDPAAARQLLAKAGYPEGRGMPKFTILYNMEDTHQSIAELIQDQWKRNLGISVELQNQEWGTFLGNLRHLEYDVARSGWIGDYLDPNAFLELFVTGGSNNETGWGSAKYDELLAAATREPDPQVRLKLLHDAEAILMDELPVIPIYFRVSHNMARPWVRGFYTNRQDVHPLKAIWIDPAAKESLSTSKGLR